MPQLQHFRYGQKVVQLFKPTYVPAPAFLWRAHLTPRFDIPQWTTSLNTNTLMQLLVPPSLPHVLASKHQLSADPLSDKGTLVPKATSSSHSV